MSAVRLCGSLHGEYAAAIKGMPDPCSRGGIAEGVDTRLGEHLVTRTRWTSRAGADAGLVGLLTEQGVLLNSAAASARITQV